MRRVILFYTHLSADRHAFSGVVSNGVYQVVEI